MDVIRVLLAADLRRRWRSWSVLLLLVAVVGGVALASLAGWRRTNSAMERFLEHHRPTNAYVEGVLEEDELAAVDGIQFAGGGDYFLLAPIDADGKVHPEDVGRVSPFSSDDPAFFRDVAVPIVVAGELSDPNVATEVMVDEEMARLYDLQPGSTLSMRGYAMEQAEEIFGLIGRLQPTGPRFDFTVTAVIRLPEDVAPQQVVPEVVYLGSAAVQLGPAFDAAHRGKDVLSLGFAFGDERGPEASDYELHVDFDRLSRAELTAQIKALDPEAFVAYAGSEATRAASEANRSIRLQAAALLALGLLTSVGGAVLVSQALRRQLDEDRAVADSLRALGASRRTGSRVALAKGVVLASLGAVLAVGVAVALSPLTPVGHARRAEIDPGVQIDSIVLAGGAVLVAAFVVARVLLAARAPSEPRGRERRGALADRAARAGFSPAIVAGVRAASISAGGRTVAASVLTAAIGIVGGMAFAASEGRLASDERLWGWTFDAVVGDGNDPALAERASSVLGPDADVAAYALVHDLDDVVLEANGRSAEVEGSAVEQVQGHIAPALLEGSAPTGPEDLALGGATARRLGVGVGDEVTVDLDDGPVPFTVTGIVVMHLGFDSDRIGEGALFVPEGLDRAGAERQPAAVFVDYAPGVDPDRMYAALQDDWGNTVLRPTRAIDVEQLHNVRHLPVAFSAVLAGVAVVTLAFVLLLTVRTRRRDLALLRTLGFAGGQLRATLVVQGLVLVVPAVLVGAVGGTVVGRLAWRATAQGLGAPEVHVLPLATVVGSIVAALVMTVVVAVVPGQVAARAHPATVLRAE